MGSGESTLEELLPYIQRKDRVQQERYMEMQQQLVERHNALHMAWSREFVRYFGVFFAVSAVGLTVGAIQRRRLVLLTPLVPLGCVLTYQLDIVYGTLLSRVRVEAERLLKSDRDKLDQPGGALTFQGIEERRLARPTSIPAFKPNLVTLSSQNPPAFDAKCHNGSCGHSTQ